MEREDFIRAEELLLRVKGDSAHGVVRRGLRSEPAKECKVERQIEVVFEES